MRKYPMRTTFLHGLCVLCLTGLSSGAFAAETITYTYDVHGRLIQVGHAGTVNTGRQSTYTFDATDNRTTVVNTVRVVVVPLNGFTIIPVPAN
jgi:hypothetical protein